VGFEELVARKLALGGGGKVGMLYAFSSISDSVILNRACAGEPGFVLAGFGPGSLRGLGESSLLDQGGIAQLWIVNYEGVYLHEAQVEHQSARELVSSLRLATDLRRVSYIFFGRVRRCFPYKTTNVSMGLNLELLGEGTRSPMLTYSRP
jgi:hypothetical protein